ncbi:hypothetical protein [Absidia glauca]|uniref:Translation initiation factor IF-3 n=1 Tax=Absidia glauca TaxID=4829 RepID=A0A168LW37_ABSGL|nr:hypothetical protein [Absidia glauca]
MNNNRPQHSNASRLEAVKALSLPQSVINKPLSKKPPTPSSPLASSAVATNKSGRARRDEEITSRWITLVDDAGQVHQRQRLDDVLQEFDRSLYFLVEVDPMSRPPVCRLFEKKQLFDKQKANKKKKTTGSDQVTKEIVFGWNVSAHDMGHKLGKAMQFLDKGNKVKVDIVYKRGQNRVDKDTQQLVIQQVKTHLDGYKVAKAPTLSGSNCTMTFEQKK